MSVPRQPGLPYPRLPLPGDAEDLVVFQHWLEKAIPMVGTLGIEQMAFEEPQLTWQLALAPNLNDKGTAFGGAMAAQSTLQGWCWVTLWLRARRLVQDVVVAESSQRFLAPITDNYRIICVPNNAEGPKQLADKLQVRGKGSITLAHKLYCSDILCMEASGSYVVLPCAKS